MNNADLPAMPQPNVIHDNGEIEYGYPGLSKREYFAGLAMQGLLSARDPLRLDRLSTVAVTAADALLYELEKRK